jgi:hypothetical protein
MPPCAPSHPAVALTRRQMIQAGLMGLAGLSLPDVLRLRARSAEPGTPPRDTAIIYVVQSGGASQLETYDPKPNASAEIRGEFSAIKTSVPGVLFSESMAEQAKIMHRLTVLRSVHHTSEQHSSSVHLTKTGYYCRADATDNEMPCIGSYAAKIRGAARPGVPPYVLVQEGNAYDSAQFLGKGFNPFQVKREPSTGHFKAPNLTLVEGVSMDRLNDRRGLRDRLDQANRIIDTRGFAEASDAHTRQAFEMVTGPHARRAFDLESEPLALRERYGRNPVGQGLLLARRLVEHGVTFVTVGTFDWDHHGTLWGRMKKDAPSFDRGIATLVQDLHERGLARRVLVVAMGEFGRTPRIFSILNNPPGRDHWGYAMSVLLAGGGFAGGQVVGATDSMASRPTEAPIRVERVLATMYRHLGIDPALTFDDHTGRPRYLLESREPIAQLK